MDRNSVRKPAMPTRLVRKNGAYWLPTPLLLTRIPDPFAQVVWPSCTQPLSREQIQRFLQAGQLERTPNNPLKEFSIDWHERRVAALVRHILDAMHYQSWPTVAYGLMPLELEMPIPSLGYWPKETLSDGFHRLSATLFLGLPGIWCMPAGSVFSVIEWVRAHPDPVFVKKFEQQFFTLHAEMDEQTGMCR